MLRNVITNRQIVNFRFSNKINHSGCSERRPISLHHGCLHGKDNTLGRQGRIISKLFGNRVAGSKKHWYPTNDPTSTPTAATSSIFQQSPFGKSGGGGGSGGGKNATRRMTVLNKLFMKHVTDLIATGAAGENIVGRGLQVTRCKTTKDFAYLNVYWLGSGDVLSDQQLEQELHRCSGLLRHELSQLRVMGEVPRINFVRERMHDNLAHVDTMLNTIEYSDEPAEGDGRQSSTLATDQAREEFYGKSSKESVEDAFAGLPEMRHDVLGLDHRDIMTKILTKMRKSKQAWDMHQQGVTAAAPQEVGDQLERVRRKLAEADENAEKFEKFLEKRRDRKNTPERKRYSRAEQLEELNAPVSLLRGGNAERFEAIREEEDFLHEDSEKSR